MKANQSFSTRVRAAFMVLVMLLGVGTAFGMKVAQDEEHTYRYLGTDGNSYIVGQSLTGVSYNCLYNPSQTCTVSSSAAPVDGRIAKDDATATSGMFTQ